MQTRAEEAAAKSFERQATVLKNLRTEYAAVAWAFLKDPHRYRDRDVQKRFRERMCLDRTQELRAAKASSPRLPPVAERAKAATNAVMAMVRTTNRNIAMQQRKLDSNQ